MNKNTKNEGRKTKDEGLITPGEWIFVAVVIGFVLYLMPVLWQRLEKFEPASDLSAVTSAKADWRMPYRLSSDYWLYKRYCQWSDAQDKILVIGDSVVWGHYVPPDKTLSHYLNELSAADGFLNLGVDGIHPIALYGLLKYYARNISGRKIILHFNPLWISSPKHDLQTEKEFQFNHPWLVPQFPGKIPCYRASYSERISAVLRRHINFLSWKSHLNGTCFDGMNPAQWSLEHPYKNPLGVIKPWYKFADEKTFEYEEKPPVQTNFQWVEPESSLQWASFRGSIELLKERGNTVFIVVGPFNEHIMNEENINTYEKIKNKIELWLQQNNVPYCMPKAPSDRFYVDASHLTGGGYALIAGQIFENSFFKTNIAP